MIQILNIEKENSQSSKKRRYGCLFWIIFFSVIFSIIFLCLILYVSKIYPPIPKEKFFTSSFDGFVQVKTEEGNFWVLFADFINTASGNLPQRKKVDPKYLNFFVNYLFYPEFLLFLKRADNNDAKESFLAVLNIRHLPNLVRKFLFNIFEENNWKKRELKEGYELYKYESDNQKFYSSIIKTSLIFSNNEEIFAGLTENLTQKNFKSGEASEEFYTHLNLIDKSSFLSGFFFNVKGRFEDYFLNDFLVGDPAREVIKDSFQFLGEQSEILKKVESILIDGKLTDRSKFQITIKGNCASEEIAKSISKILNERILPEIKKTASKSENILTVAESKEKICIVKIDFLNIKNIMKEIFEDIK